MTHKGYNVIYNLVLVFILSISSVCSTQLKNRLPPIITSLEEYKSPDGTFFISETNRVPSLEATYDALFLSDLLGLKNQINYTEVAQYIQSLQNNDFGFSPSSQLPSDLISVRNALLCFRHLGIPFPQNISGFIQSLFHSESGFFSNRPGESADLKATAFGLQSLELLGLKIDKQAVLKLLKAHVKQANEEQFFFHFPQEINLAPLSANYYGILIGSLVGYEFGNVSKWISYVISQQTSGKYGVFYSDITRTHSSLEASYHAIMSLHLLGKLSGLNAMEWVKNIDGLLAYLKKVPPNLQFVYQAYSIVAVVQPTVLFDYILSYEDGEIYEHTVIQGWPLKPLLTVTAIPGVVHSGLAIRAMVTLPGQSTPKELGFFWEKTTQQYVANDAINTMDKLGIIRFLYVVQCFPEMEVSFSFEDIKHVSYGITVASDANIAGKPVEEGQTVVIGTSFQFGVSLHNQSIDSFVSGNFDVVFSVLDSSMVCVHRQVLNGLDNKDPIAFSYDLENPNIPSGLLSFRFDIQHKPSSIVPASDLVHSSYLISYELAMKMIASEITFSPQKENPFSYRLGEKLTISMVPASFPDLRTVYAYGAFDAEKRDISRQRVFVLDVSSANGVALQRVLAIPQMTTSKTLRCAFLIDLLPTLDTLGNRILSFKYISSNGEEIELANYDSSIGELFDDSVLLSYSVNSELHLVDVEESPNRTEFYYGDMINFRFRIKDSISGNYVLSGVSNSTNVNMQLKHLQGSKGKTFISVNSPAVMHINTSDNRSEYLIRWDINPNAVRGSGFLTLVVLDADGNTIPVYVDKLKQEVQYSVTIGGDIDLQSTFFVSDAKTKEAAFIYAFQLFCQGRPLPNAQLRAVLSFRAGEEDDLTVLAVFPVAIGDVGYEVSWTMPHRKAPTGQYLLQFYREGDRIKILEGQSLKANSTSDFEDSVKPLFEANLVYQGPSIYKLPIRSQTLATFFLFAAFVFLYFRKTAYLK